MSNRNFVVQNGLTVGPLTIDATTGDIVTAGNITSLNQTASYETISMSEAITGNLTVTNNINVGSLPYPLGTAIYLDDISAEAQADWVGTFASFPLTINGTAINSITDSKNLAVYVNGSRLTPYIAGPTTWPWTPIVGSYKGFKVVNLPSSSNAAVTAGRIGIYAAIPKNSQIDLVWTSATTYVQTRSRYPFTAMTVYEI